MALMTVAAIVEPHTRTCDMAKAWKAEEDPGWGCSCPQTIIPDAWRYTVVIWGPMTEIGSTRRATWEDWFFDDEFTASLLLYQSVPGACA